MSDFRDLFRDNLIKRFSLNDSDNQFQDLENNLKIHFAELNKILSKCLSDANNMGSIITWSSENTKLSDDKDYISYIIELAGYVRIHKEDNKIVITKCGDTIFECESDLDIIKMARDYKEYKEIGKELFDSLDRTDVLKDSLAELFGLSSVNESVSCTRLILVDDPQVELKFSLEFELKREELKVEKVVIKKDLVGVFGMCSSFKPKS